MDAVRFYFTDAAVEGYFREMVGNVELRQFSTKIRDIVESLNVALLGLVGQFIQQRGFAYRKV
jgi:hypothetical protein